MFWVDIWSDGDLSLEWFHEDGIFIEAFHVHLLDGKELVIFDVFNLEDFTIASFSNENSLLPIVTVSEREVVILHNVNIYYEDYMNSYKANPFTLINGLNSSFSDICC